MTEQTAERARLAEYEAWATGELSEISDEAMAAGRKQTQDRQFERLLTEAVEAHLAMDDTDLAYALAYQALEDVARARGMRYWPGAFYDALALAHDARAAREREEG